MLFTLQEILEQIDPQVVLDDGVTMRTVAQLLFSSKKASTPEYVIGLDGVGRLSIYEIDRHGFAIFPAAFVELRSVQVDHAITARRQSPTTPNFLPRPA